MGFLIVIILVIVAVVVIVNLAGTTSGSRAYRSPRREADAEMLRQQGMPVLQTLEELAAALGITEKQLRWLMDKPRQGQPPLRSPHYVQFRIPKSGGGERVLLAPKPRLKAAQRWILREILRHAVPHDAAHGFRRGRSILTNALPHVDKEAVACFDLADFFPTITFPRVRGLFQALGYGIEVAGALAYLCTTRMEPGAKRRVLPQGAPSSPAISNLITKRMDTRLAGLAVTLGYSYTRYADDCTMSGAPRNLNALIRTVRIITSGEGFRLHDKKLRIRRQGARQQVTGLVVNAAPTITRSERRRLRAVLHQARTTGLEAQNRAGHPHFLDYLRGKIAFLSMVHPGHAAPLARALAEISGEAQVLVSAPAPAVLPVAAPPAAPTPVTPPPPPSFERGLDAYTPGPEQNG
ncbi:MAG: reverse transcriptase family protein [Armatimonadota bacterium]